MEKQTKRRQKNKDKETLATEIVTPPPNLPRRCVIPSSTNENPTITNSTNSEIEILDSDYESESNDATPSDEANTVPSPGTVLTRQTMDLLDAESDNDDDLFYALN